MLHFLVGFVKLPGRGAILEQQTIWIAEINRTAPFVIDHCRHVHPATEQLLALGLERWNVLAVQRKVIERAGQSLRAVDVGGPFVGYARHFFRAHEGHESAVAGIEKDVPDLAALGGLDDVAPSDLETELFGVELDRAIDIERGQSDVMNAFAIHRVLSMPKTVPGATTSTAPFPRKDFRTIVQDVCSGSVFRNRARFQFNRAG